MDNVYRCRYFTKNKNLTVSQKADRVTITYHHCVVFDS